MKENKSVSAFPPISSHTRKTGLIENSNTAANDGERKGKNGDVLALCVLSCGFWGGMTEGRKNIKLRIARNNKVASFTNNPWGRM